MARAIRRRRSLDRDEESLDEAAPTQAVDRAEPLTSRLVAESHGDPAVIADRLSHVDQTSQARTLHSLQRERGNLFVQAVVRSMAASDLGARSGGSGAGFGRGETITLERQADDEGQEAEPMDATDITAADLADIPDGATEEVGPTTSSSYPVSATSLSDVASQLSARDEAGYCGWKEAWTYRTSPTGKISAVKVKVTIDIEMPAWTVPPSMLPKAKAEWERSYQALLAHERGHEKLVHDYFDGLADKILGKTVRAGRQLFEGAKANLAAASRAYDGRTGNGTKTGTIIDTTIEQKELDEKKKADEEKRKAEKAGRKAETEAEGPEPAETPA